jgi:hypothetical protein
MDMACVLVGRMRSWCVDLFESGPFWVREQAMMVIESCDELSACFQKDPDIEIGAGGIFGQRVVRLCLGLGRRAPAGWHSRLMKGDKAYRERFTTPRVQAVRPS